MIPPADPAATPRYRSLLPAATFLQLLYGLFIIATFVFVLTGWAYRGALLDVVGSTGNLGSAIRREDNFVAASGVLGGVNIVLVVAFISWFWRAYSNLAALGVTTRRKAWWAIGSWVIPIANFFVPYQIGSEIWRKSVPDDSGTGVAGDMNMEPVISWWALFLLMGLVNQVSFFSGRDVGDDAAGMAAVVGVGLIGGIVSIAAALAAFRFVRRSTARQEATMRRRTRVSDGPVG